MKTILKSIILLFVIISLSSCEEQEKKALYNKDNSFKNYKIVRIDGCEYIQWRTSYGFLSITHKGNCDNPIHKK